MDGPEVLGYVMKQNRWQDKFGGSLKVGVGGKKNHLRVDTWLENHLSGSLIAWKLADGSRTNFVITCAITVETNETYLIKNETYLIKANNLMIADEVETLFRGALE